MLELVELREFLSSDKGRLLLCYLTDFMIEISVKSNANAEWIKGMGYKNTNDAVRGLCGYSSVGISG